MKYVKRKRAITPLIKG